MVSAAQKALVKESWSTVDRTAAGRTFYVRFSEVAPDAFALFKFGGENVHTSAKVGAQAEKTFNFLDSAVKGIDNMSNVEGSSDQLGRRHTSYGVKKAQFAAAGDILMFTLEKHCGKWNASVKDAWTAFYKVISDHVTAQL